jgi:hypothetical protein
MIEVIIKVLLTGVITVVVVTIAMWWVVDRIKKI